MHTHTFSRKSSATANDDDDAFLINHYVIELFFKVLFFDCLLLFYLFCSIAAKINTN